LEPGRFPGDGVIAAKLDGIGVDEGGSEWSLRMRFRIFWTPESRFCNEIFIAVQKAAALSMVRTN
jgi:hypothetical protein